MVGRILIVDDEQDITKLIQINLTRDGFETRVAYNGYSAIAIANEWIPDLILLDIMMPQMDGYETCRRIRSNKATCHIPIIMLTAKSRITDKVEGFDAGANDYITKPYLREDLRIRIEAHINRTRELQELSKDTTECDILMSYRHLESAIPALHSPVDNPSVTVVVPTLNEEDCISEVLTRIPKWVDEVLLVDGHSTDNTVELAKKLMPSIRVVYQEGRGKGDALRYGFENAKGDIVVAIDADGSTDPAEIPAYVGALLAGADYAKGTRFLQGAGTSDMPLYRKLGNQAFVTLVKVLFGGRFSDLLYGYNAFWKSVLPLLDLKSDGFEIETEMNIHALRAGLRITEVASFESERIEGTAKLRALPDGWRVLKTIFREIFRRQPDPKTLQLGESEKEVFTKTEIDTTELSVSVVMRAYTEDRWNELVLALDSIYAQTRQPEEIVVVIDNNPQLMYRLKAHFPDIVIKENYHARGSSGAWNSGIELATGDILVFLDDDAVAEPTWLEMLVAHYSDSDVAGVGGFILPIWEENAPPWFPKEFYWVVGCSYVGQPTKLAPVRNLIGCNMSMRRKVFGEIGGFREGFGHNSGRPSGCEETDICIRVRQYRDSYVLLHDPEALVHHHVPECRTNLRYFIRRCYLEGRSKALIAQFAGKNTGLSTETQYAMRVLPKGIWQNLGQVFRGDLNGLSRSIMIVVGLSVTTAAYVMGRLIISTRDLTDQNELPAIREIQLS